MGGMGRGDGRLKGGDGMVGEYRRWGEKVGKGVGEDRVV